MVDNTVIFPSPDEIFDAIINLESEIYSSLLKEEDIYKRVKDIEDTIKQKEKIDFYIDYAFEQGIRKNTFNVKYGSAIDFETLYELLIEQNSGISFIDEYLDLYYRYSSAKDIVDSLLEPLQENIKDIIPSLFDSLYTELEESLELLKETDKSAMLLNLTKKGLLDKRQKGKIFNILSNIDEIKKRIDNITKNIDSVIPKSSQEKIAQTIKEDIKMAIKTGKIGLVNPILKPETIKRRLRAGLPPMPKFYASGQFVDHIKIIVQLKEKEWRTM